MTANPSRGVAGQVVSSIRPRGPELDRLLTGHGDRVAGSVRRIAALTAPEPPAYPATVPVAVPVPPASVYALLGRLEVASGLDLARVLSHLTGALYAALEAYEVTEDDGSLIPVTNTNKARAHLTEAARHSVLTGKHLGYARDAIAGQSHRHHAPTPTPGKQVRP